MIIVSRAKKSRAKRIQDSESGFLAGLGEYLAALRAERFAAFLVAERIL